jgi:DNA-binding MarR family transcriptional regulator
MSASQQFPTEDSAILLMRVALQGLQRRATAHLAEYGIPWSVWYFLRILWENDGLSQKELALRAGVLQPNAVATIRTREKMGLARIERAEQDQRRICVWLTAKGKELEERVLPRIGAEMERIVFHNLDEGEQEMLIRLLKKVCANAER